MTNAPATMFTQLAAEARPFAWLWSAVADMQRGMKARYQYRHLLSCEDHILSDLGLTRADVLQAMKAER